MIDLDKIMEEINEGIWALPKSYVERQERGHEFISLIEQYKDEIYNVFGDDILFDHFDNAIKRIEELMAIPEEEIKEGLNEDVVIPAALSQQYLVIKKQMADKQTQRDQLMKQVNQKENEINILNKNLIAIEQKAAQQQGKEAAVKSGETAKPENTEEATANEGLQISDLFAELNEMDKDWLVEMGAPEFEEEGEGEAGEVADVLDYEDIEDEQEATDEDLNSDYVFAIRVNSEEEDEIIAKVYRNKEDDFWKIRVVQGDEEPLETMQFDPDMEFVDIIEKIGEIYDDVEEISMEEYKGLLDDKMENDDKYYPDKVNEYGYDDEAMVFLQSMADLEEQLEERSPELWYNFEEESGNFWRELGVEDWREAFKADPMGCRAFKEKLESFLV